jgi:hypothetical protein
MAGWLICCARWAMVALPGRAIHAVSGGWAASSRPAALRRIRWASGPIGSVATASA